MMALSESSHYPATELEALDRSRRQMLVAVVVTSTLWFLPQILSLLGSDAISRELNLVLVLAGVAGSFTWMYSMWRYHRFQQRVLADPELRERLDDERVIALRKEAILRGWVILLVALAVAVAAAPFTELPDLPVLLTLLLLGGNAPIVAFLIMDRD